MFIMCVCHVVCYVLCLLGAAKQYTIIFKVKKINFKIEKVAEVKLLEPF